MAYSPRFALKELQGPKHKLNAFIAYRGDEQPPRKHPTGGLWAVGCSQAMPRRPDQGPVAPSASLRSATRIVEALWTVLIWSTHTLAVRGHRASSSTSSSGFKVFRGPLGRRVCRCVALQDFGRGIDGDATKILAPQHERGLPGVERLACTLSVMGDRQRDFLVRNNWMAMAVATWSGPKRSFASWSRFVDSVIYLVGLVVVILFILSALGLR